MKNYRYITDTSAGNYISYQARVPPFIDGVPYYAHQKLVTHSFCATVFGNKKKALAAAKQWVADYFIENDMPLDERLDPLIDRVMTLSPRNQSGVIGVSLRYVSKARTSKEYRATWQAFDKDGKRVRKHKTYNCNTYGTELAFELACIDRWENAKPERPLIVVNKAATPCLPPVPYLITESI